MDASKYTIFVPFDFFKAFHKILHHIIMHTLRSFKVSDPTLQWFISYFADGCQAAVVEGSNLSDWLAMAAGVPQGSVNEHYSLARYCAHLKPHKHASSFNNRKSLIQTLIFP